MEYGRSLNQLSRLDDRVALIVGGAGHIGRVAADGLAEMGATIVIADISLERSKEVASDLQSRHGVQTLAIEVDLENEVSVKELPKTVMKNFGRIDNLIHLAAIVDPELGGWTCKFEEQTPEQWRRGLEINLTSAFLLAQGCIDPLRKSGHGSILLFGSTYGIVGPDWSIYESTEMGNAAGYAASKGGIIQLTRWLATTLAPLVRVNSLSPGGVYRNHLDSFHNAYSNRTPLKRMATEDDYKGAVAFLASDLSSYVTGHNLVVDGGWTIW